MTLHFASLFDHNYLARGEALFDSLKEHCPEFKFYALCLDERTHRQIAEASRTEPRLIAISLAELEEDEPALSDARKNRSLVEYYFTLSPCLPLYVLKKFGAGHVCTLDADQLFYSDPTPLFSLLSNHAVMVTAHNFSPGLEASQKFGMFNVSFQVFRNDPIAIGCLGRWRDQCLEWCKDVYDEAHDRFADQKYLDGWPALLGAQLHVFNHPGVGLAAWNVDQFKLTRSARGHEVDGQPLIVYHFHGFKQLSARWAGNGFGLYHVRPNRVLLDLYADYWQRLEARQVSTDPAGDRVIRRPVSSRLLGRMVEERSLFYRLRNNRVVYVRLTGLIRWMLKLLGGG